MGVLGDEHEELKSFMLMYWPSIRITTLVGAAVSVACRRSMR